jgi:hypothetical protein
MTVWRLLIFFLLGAAGARAQVPFFQHYALLKNKSPQINTLYRDKTGFVWIGTNEGLFKFNGTTFRQFTRSDSLPDNQVTAIAEDSLGRIWTGHRSGGIGMVERDRVTKFNTIVSTGWMRKTACLIFLFTIWPRIVQAISGPERTEE